jgi:hypothetical protein
MDIYEKVARAIEEAEAQCLKEALDGIAPKHRTPLRPTQAKAAIQALPVVILEEGAEPIEGDLISFLGDNEAYLVDKYTSWDLRAAKIIQRQGKPVIYRGVKDETA